ncbi:hypothetical protein D3C80_2206400 [compost metagenome]
MMLIGRLRVVTPRLSRKIGIRSDFSRTARMISSTGFSLMPAVSPRSQSIATHE